MAAKLSWVRVKAWSIEAVFLACWLAVSYGNLTDDQGLLAFWVAALAVVMLLFVRCEGCDSYEFWDGSDTIPFIPRVSWRIYWPPKRCPVCGLERH